MFTKSKTRLLILYCFLLIIPVINSAAQAPPQAHISLEITNPEEEPVLYVEKPYKVKVLLVDEERYPFPGQTVVFMYCGTTGQIEMFTEEKVTDENGEAEFLMVFNKVDHWHYEAYWAGNEEIMGNKQDASIDVVIDPNLRGIEHFFNEIPFLPGYSVYSICIGLVCFVLLYVYRCE